MLQVRGLSKAYGRVQALSAVDAEFRPGEVHALLGENGAGKSTFVEVVNGFVLPDAGTVRLDGELVELGNPTRCRERGIAMVHQHFALVPEFTVAENFALARLDAAGTVLNVTDLAKPALDEARSLGWEIPADAKVSDLPVGVQQRIEIVKGLSGGSRVLLLDEPTAVLAGPEVEELFRVMRKLRELGRIVVLIAHKLTEVLEVADRVTVLRQGKKVAEAPIGEVDADTLSRWMVGEMPTAGKRHGPGDRGPAGLVARGLHVIGDRGEEAVRGIDIEVAQGEIVGIGGVDGNGQVELAEAVARIRPARGELSFAQGAATKIGYIPQDRQDEGLASQLSVADNLLIGLHRRPEMARGPFLIGRRMSEVARDLVTRFEIKVSSLDAKAASLSGGNQQKIVVSRVLAEAPDVLVAVNPTRGLDVRAVAYVHDKLRGAAAEGAAVLLITTDLEELFELSDRAYFMSRGVLHEGQDQAAVLGGAAS